MRELAGTSRELGNFGGNTADLGTPSLLPWLRRRRQGNSLGDDRPAPLRRPAAHPDPNGQKSITTQEDLEREFLELANEVRLGLRSLAGAIEEARRR